MVDTENYRQASCRKNKVCIAITAAFQKHKMSLIPWHLKGKKSHLVDLLIVYVHHATWHTTDVLSGILSTS